MTDLRAGRAVPEPLPVYLTADSADTLINVRVIPRAGQTGLAGERAGALLVRLAAPPVDNAANDALLRFLADVLQAPRSTLGLAQGDRSRSKRVRVRQMAPGVAAARLAAAQGITLL